MKYFLVIAFFSEALLAFDKINIYNYINATHIIGIIILIIFNFFIFKKIDLNEKNKIVIIIFLISFVIINLYLNKDYTLLDNIFLIFYLLSNITIYILFLYINVYVFKRYKIKYAFITVMSLILIYSNYNYNNPYDAYNFYLSKKILKKLYIKSGYILHYGYLNSLKRKDNNCTIKNEVYKINEVFKNMEQSEIKEYQKNKKLFYDKGE